MADGGGDLPSLPAATLTPRSLRPFRSDEEYLYAMQEDLAEWLHVIYPTLDVSADTFFEALEDGVVLCGLANRALTLAGEEQKVPCRTQGVRPGTFHARDNVAHFIQWCRGWLRVPECLLFESDDLVMRKNRRSFVLCLLEVARRGASRCPGLPAPMLVLLEREIDEEIARDAAGLPSPRQDNKPRRPGRLLSKGTLTDPVIPTSWVESDCSGAGHEADDDSDAFSETTTTASPSPPNRQIVTNDLRSLHERVAELLSRCRCPAQFPMIRVGDGKYRIGETQLLIFVRVLRSHVMVRVGGGWDTLEHYLDKHDPCRGRSSASGRRFSASSKGGSSENGPYSINVTYQRGTPSSSSSSRSSISPPPSRNQYSYSPAHIVNSNDVAESRRRITASTTDLSRRSSFIGQSSSECENEKKRRPPSRRSSLRNSFKSGMLLDGDSEDSHHSSSPSPVSSHNNRPYASHTNGDLNSDKDENCKNSSPVGRKKDTSKDNFNGGSKIPTSSPSRNSTNSQRRRGSAAQRYRSTENLETRSLASSRSETCLVQNGLTCQTRRSRGHTFSYAGSGTLPRSRSGETSASTINYRRQRSASASRNSQDYSTTNLYRAPSISSCQSSPGGKPPVPPLLEEILQDSDLLDTDEKLLQKMERLIREYRTRDEESSCDSYPSFSSASQNGNDSKQTTHSRRSSGLLTPGGSPSKIPVFAAWSGRN